MCPIWAENGSKCWREQHYSYFCSFCSFKLRSKVEGVTDHAGRLPERQLCELHRASNLCCESARLSLFQEGFVHITVTWKEQGWRLSFFLFFCCWKAYRLYLILNWVSCQSLNSSLMFLLQKMEWLLNELVGKLLTHFPCFFALFSPFFCCLTTTFWKQPPLKSVSHLSLA